MSRPKNRYLGFGGQDISLGDKRGVVEQAKDGETLRSCFAWGGGQGVSSGRVVRNSGASYNRRASVTSRLVDSFAGAGLLGRRDYGGCRSSLLGSAEEYAMGLPMSRPVQEDFRTIHVLWKGVTPPPQQQHMADNSVVTAKYNVLTFIPRSLFEQFRRVANIYFLVISILMVIGTYTTLFTSPLTPWSTLIPLVFVLMITMVKDGAEDLKRHRSDRRVST